MKPHVLKAYEDEFTKLHGLDPKKHAWRFELFCKTTMIFIY